MDTIELSQAEIRLLILSLKKTQEWLQNQKGQLGGVLIGFGKIDEHCEELQSLIDRLNSLNETTNL